MPEPETTGLGTKRDFAIYLGIVVAAGIGLFLLLRDARQTLAFTIFLATAFGTLMFWKIRVAIAFLGLVLLLITQTVNLTTAIKFMNLHVILFLVGMMVIVGLLRQCGFFRWLLVNDNRHGGNNDFWLNHIADRIQLYRLLCAHIGIFYIAESPTSRYHCD